MRLSASFPRTPRRMICADTSPRSSRSWTPSARRAQPPAAGEEETLNRFIALQEHGAEAVRALDPHAVENGDQAAFQEASSELSTISKQSDKEAVRAGISGCVT